MTHAVACFLLKNLCGFISKNSLACNGKNKKGVAWNGDNNKKASHTNGCNMFLKLIIARKFFKLSHALKIFSEITG